MMFLFGWTFDFGLGHYRILLLVIFVRVFGSVGMYRARALGENVVLSKEVSGRSVERVYAVVCCLNWSMRW